MDVDPVLGWLRMQGVGIAVLEAGAGDIGAGPPPLGISPDRVATDVGGAVEVANDDGSKKDPPIPPGTKDDDIPGRSTPEKMAEIGRRSKNPS